MWKRKVKKAKKTKKVRKTGKKVRKRKKTQRVKRFATTRRAAVILCRSMVTVARYCREIEAAGGEWKKTPAGKLFRKHKLGRPKKIGPHWRWQILIKG